MPQLRELILCLAVVGTLGAQNVVETLEHTYGPFSLKAGALQQVPPVMEMRFPEALWLVGYRTEMLDAAGKPVSREFQCHTLFGSSMPQPHSNDDVVGLFSDGYTPGLTMPAGYGLYFEAGEKMVWNPMFNNRNSEPQAAAMRLELDVIRARNLKQPLKPLRTTFRTIRAPGDLYFVAPGKDVRETSFEMPFSGTIHVIGTHIHPYGVSIELTNLTRGTTVWTAMGSRDTAGRLVQMPVYQAETGYAVKRNERFRLTAVYDNPTRGKVDAMAGVFILYSPETGHSH